MEEGGYDGWIVGVLGCLFWGSGEGEGGSLWREIGWGGGEGGFGEDLVGEGWGIDGRGRECMYVCVCSPLSRYL